MVLYQLVLMLLTGIYIAQVSFPTVEQAPLIMQLLLLDIKAMELGLSEILGVQIGVNKDILDLVQEIHVELLNMLLFQL